MSNKRRFSDRQEYVHPLKKQKFELYLDDYTPIRTVEVTSLEDHVCPGYLRAYFECKIGQVSDVIIINRKMEENQKMRVGIVTFTLPEDAAALICDSNLINCKFTIKQASNAFQPTIDPKALKLTEMNNDCLQRIASFLNTIDTINLGKASRALQSFVDQEIFAKWTNFEFDSVQPNDLSINKTNLPEILRVAGKYFESIEWISLTDHQIDQLQEHCQNVTALKLVAPNLHLNSLETSRDWFKNLKALQINDANFSDVYMKAVIATATQLESLQLVDCHNVKGDFLAEWKDSQLKYLRINQCPGVSPSNISDFQRNNKLVKFSSDAFDSFVMCLSLPTPCLEAYTELELAVNATTDEKLDLLKFHELQQLDKLRLKSTFYNTRIGFDVTVAKSFNNIFVAMNPIDSLRSLCVERIIIDGDTFKCLGSIRNLREVHLKRIYNGVGTEMYSTLCVHLPLLTKLSMSMVDTNEQIDVKAICDMIFGLVDLEYLSHSNMTRRLLNEIRNVQMVRKQPSPIEIGISPVLFRELRKDQFAETSNGVVKLSLVNSR